METTTLNLRVFGLPMSVDVPTQRAAALRAQWSWCLPDAEAQRTIAAIGGGTVPSDPALGSPLTRPDVDDDADGHVADYRLTTALTGQAITACAGRVFMFHAAGFADTRTGRVAGLVAPSGTGKTTAARTFCSTPEFGYVTDETLVVNDAGDVLPYPKPLSVIIDAGDRRKSQHGPEELGFTAPPAGPLTLGPLLVLDRVEDGSAPRLEPLSVIEGLKAVLPQSSAAPLVPDCLERIAELARRGGGFLQLTYSEITDTPDAVRQALALAPAERDWVHVPGTWPTGVGAPGRFGQVPDTTPRSELSSETRLERGPFVDAIALPDVDEVLVLVGDMPTHLRGVGALAWTHLDEPRTVAQIVAHCIATFGDHPDAEPLVHDALQRLEDSRVIVRTTEATGEARSSVST